MEHSSLVVLRKCLIPCAALLIAATLGGCIGYTAYPASSYNYPAGYYSGYPANYAYTNYPPFYSPSYNSYYNNYSATGGGR